jgi:hypothetical protein
MPVTVTAIEQLPAKQESSRDPRDAVIYELVTSSADPADLLRLTLSDNRGRAGTLSRFEILGHAGYIMRYDAYKPVPNDPFGRYLVVPGWFAAAVVPGAGPEGKNLGVVIGVEGYDTAGPAGRGLIRQLADGLSLPK